MEDIQLILDDYKKKSKNLNQFNGYLSKIDYNEKILKEYYFNIKNQPISLYKNCYYNNIPRDYTPPKCPICNKERKLHKGFNFLQTCGNKECISKLNKNHLILNDIKELDNYKHLDIKNYIKTIKNKYEYDSLFNILNKKYNSSNINLMLNLFYNNIEYFEIPKCICGKECLYISGLKFHKTCGDKKCIINNTKQTNLKKYNNEIFTRTDEYKQKTNKVILEKRKERYNKIILDNNINVFIENDKCICNECGTNFDIFDSFVNERFLYRPNIICPKCYELGKTQKSNSEEELYRFVKSLILDKEILRNKRILDEYEIDIYIPDLKIGFEYNGLYWHSEIHKDKHYHKNKSKKASEQGIRLIHIWEDDWNYKNEIVKSRIRNLLGKTEKRVYGRNTKIKEISYQDCKQFLDENHIQGCGVGNIRYGLYFNNELVSVIQIDSSGQLSRFANKLNTNVIGGFSKLFKHCEHYIKYTFIDLDWSSENNIYSKYMKFDSYVEPTWYLLYKGKRMHRRNFQKKKLLQTGLGNPEQTEHEITLSNKLYRIYNSGNIKYVRN